MKAQELIDAVVVKKYRPFSRVVVEKGRAGVHYALKPDQDVPDEDEDTTVFLRLENVS